MELKLFYWGECGGSCMQRPHPFSQLGLPPYRIHREELYTGNKSKNITQGKKF